MKKIEKKYKVLIFILVGILILTILNFSLKDRSLSFPEKIIKDSGMLIEKIFYKPINFVGGKVSNLFSHDKDYERLKQLEEEFLIQQTLVKEQKSTIEELKGVLAITYTLEDYKEISATVIKRNIDNWYDTIVLDRGEKNGIEIGMAVVNKDGLIGIVSNTSYFTSTVKLVSSSFRISAKIMGENEIYGIIKEYKDGFYIMEGISENTLIENGYDVYTTGLGNEIPSGLKLGTVEKEERDNFDLNRTIYIKPSMNLENINYVKVLKRNIK